MNMEERVFEIHRIQILVEFVVVFTFEFCGCFAPKRSCCIDNTGDFIFDLFDIAFLVFFSAWILYPVGRCAVDDFHGHEFAILCQNALYASVF